MTGQPGRSGGANGGPQYDPANVNPLGGNGQSGQAKQYISGLPYGQGQATMQQQSGAPMAKASVPSAQAPDLGSLSQRFCETFMATWQGEVDSDPLTRW